MSFSMNEPDYHRFCDSTPCAECRERYLEQCQEHEAEQMIELYSRRADSGWA